MIKFYNSVSVARTPSTGLDVLKKLLYCANVELSSEPLGKATRGDHPAERIISAFDDFQKIYTTERSFLFLKSNDK